MDHANESHEAAHSKALAATTDVNMTEAPVTWKAYLLCAFASFGGIFFGYDSGYINGVLNSPLFIEEVQGPVCPQGLATPGGGCVISSNNTSLIVSILSAGTFFGALAAGDIADIYGRKWTIVAGCIIYIIGVILQMAASGRDLLVAGRAIAGVGVGFESAIVILYMSEICPKKVRGALVSGYQFCITIGLLLAACVNYSVQGRNDTGQYRIPIGIQFAWGIILAGGIACLPDSPRYFIKRGKTAEAKKALMKVRGVHPTKPDAEHLRAMVEFELAEIIANEEYEREQTPAGGWLAGWTNCFKGSLFQSNSNLRKTILGTSLQMMQQWTGVNFIFYYSTPFLESTGAIKNTFLISLIFTLVNVCSTPLSFYGMEKFGRRTLLLYGALGMLICQFLVAIIGVTVGFNKSITLADGTTRANNLSAVNAQIAFIAIFIFCFATTWGPGAWVLIGEVFPLPIRSRGVALSTASNWLWNTIIAVITPYMVGKNEGNLRSSVFFIWGGLCTIAFVYTYFLVPETKGLSLEQVDQMMAETTPRTSAKWRPTHTFAESSIEKGGAARVEGDQVFIDTEKVQRTASIH
jgi:sugar porter (SP) family MFS transporter